MKIKVKVKSLTITKSIACTNNTTSSNTNYAYCAAFTPLDKGNICNEVCYLGTANNNIIKVPEEALSNINLGDKFFNFISTHSNEIFIITVDYSDNNGNSEYFLKEVSLIYG